MIPVALARRPRIQTLAPVLFVVAIAAVVRLGGWWQGVDVPAHIYRIDLFRAHGFTLWDPNWYGGHYSLPYSVLFPAVAAVLTLPFTVAATAALAVFSFDRLVRRYLTATALPVVAAFSLGLVVPIAVGRYPYLAGISIALSALVLATGGRLVPSLVLAFAASLFSPVAGAFLALAAVTWAIADRPRRSAALAVGAATAAPLLALGLLFPDPGRFPFWAAEFFAVVVVGVLGIVFVPARLRALRIGLGLYVAVAVVLFFVANPMGGNLGRLAEDFSPSLAIGSALVGRRRVIAFLAIPAFAWQLTGLTTVHAAAADPSSRQTYYAPMLAFLGRQDGPARVEIPFTRDHWEATYVALKVPLARGWERQLDISNNGIFYSDEPLTADRYRAWLDAQGVSWIALPDVPLDYSAQGEAKLLAQADTLPFLHLAWHDAHWKVWRVTTSPGLVTGPARLVSLDTSGFVLQAKAPGEVVVRVHAAPAWSLASSNACTTESDDGWTHVTVLRAGRVSVRPTMEGDHACDDGP